MSDDKRPLTERVEKWLNDSGIPLEFRVAEAFRRRNMQVASQQYIDDPLTGSRREVDVVAELARAIPIAAPLSEGAVPATIYVSTVVECKDHDKPWIVFGYPEVSEHASPDADGEEVLNEDRIAAATNTVASLLGRAGLWHLVANSLALGLPMFQPAPSLAHGGTTVFRKPNQKDEFYDAVQQVVSGAVAHVQEQFDNTFWLCASMANVVLPVIVVTQPLFYSYLCPGAEHLEISEVKRARLVWSGSKAWTPYVPNIDIVHADVLDEFVNERRTETQQLLDLISPAIQNIAAVMRGRDISELTVPVEWRHPQRLPRLLQNPRHFRNPDYTPQPPG